MAYGTNQPPSSRHRFLHLKMESNDMGMDALIKYLLLLTVTRTPNVVEGDA